MGSRALTRRVTLLALTLTAPLVTRYVATALVELRMGLKCRAPAPSPAATSGGQDEKGEVVASPPKTDEPLPPPPPEGDRAATPATTISERAQRLWVELGVSVTQFLRGHTLLGGRLSVTASPFHAVSARLGLEVGARSGLTLTSAGPVRLESLGARVFTAICTAGRPSLCGVAGAELARGTLTPGVPSTDQLVALGAMTSSWWGLFGGPRLGLDWEWFTLAARLELGRVARPIIGLVEGRPEVGLEGFWFEAGATAGVRW